VLRDKALHVPNDLDRNHAHQVLPGLLPDRRGLVGGNVQLENLKKGMCKGTSITRPQLRVLQARPMHPPLMFQLEVIMVYTIIILCSVCVSLLDCAFSNIF
jgi:hypothetical protein